MSQKPGRLVDEHGNPISGKGEQPEDLNLPAGVQALIETRLNSAVDRLRELNDSDLRDLSREHSKKWRYVAFISLGAAALSFLWGWFSWFVAPDQLRNWVKDQVDRRMTEPLLRDAADRAIRDKMAKYVDEKIRPLAEQAGAVAKRIEGLSTDLERKQDQLRIDQDAVRRQVRIQEFALAAKVGGMKEYQELKSLANSNSEFQAQAKVALQEVNWYFDVDRASLVYLTLVDPVSKGNPGYSVEEAIAMLRDGSSGNRQAAVNCLYGHNRKLAVQDICEELEKETDLCVIARITRAMEKLTGEKFSPLDKEAVLAWWGKHAKEKEYQSPYAPYLKACGFLNRGDLAENDIKEAVGLLDGTIQKDPDALHARCLRAVFLVLQNKLDDAEKEFKEVEKRDKDFRWLLFWKPFLYISRHKIDAATGSLNKAMEKSPYLENYARVISLYQPLLTNTNIVWPSVKNAQK